MILDNAMERVEYGDILNEYGVYSFSTHEKSAYFIASLQEKTYFDKYGYFPEPEDFGLMKYIEAMK